MARAIAAIRVWDNSTAHLFDTLINKVRSFSVPAKIILGTFLMFAVVGYVSELLVGFPNYSDQRLFGRFHFVMLSTLFGVGCQATTIAVVWWRHSWRGVWRAKWELGHLTGTVTVVCIILLQIYVVLRDGTQSYLTGSLGPLLVSLFATSIGALPLYFIHWLKEGWEHTTHSCPKTVNFITFLKSTLRILSKTSQFDFLKNSSL